MTALKYEFPGMKHHGKLEIEWDESGNVRYKYEGNAWYGAIEDVSKFVATDIGKSGNEIEKLNCSETDMEYLMKAKRHIDTCIKIKKNKP